MQPKYSTKIKAVIFDNDGTLIDSMKAYALADEQVVGHPIDAAVEEKVAGKTAEDICRLLKSTYGLKDDLDTLVERRTQFAQENFKNLKLMPGAEKVVNDLVSRGIRASVATSSRKIMFDLKAEKYPELYEKMDHIICGDNVKKGKPAPDLFLTAMNKWEGIKPEEIIVFEDAVQGIEAATAAGMASVLVTKDENAEKILKQENITPTYYIKTFEEFDMSFFNWAI